MFTLFHRCRKRHKKVGEKPYRDWHDWATLITNMVGIGLVVATIYITLHSQAANDEAMSNALGSMADIANSMEAERPAVERGANAAADSAAAAKATAGLVQGQTSAVVRQADALIKSAQATIAATSAQLASAQAIMKTAEAGASAAQEQRRSAELIAAARAPSARLATVPLEGWNQPPDNEGRTLVTIKPTYLNNGGGDLSAGRTTFSLRIGDNIPASPPEAVDHTFGGNEIHIAPGGHLNPLQP